MAEPNPNDMDYYRVGEPIVGLAGKVTEWDFDLFRVGEPSQTLLAQTGSRTPRPGFVAFGNGVGLF